MRKQPPVTPQTRIAKPHRPMPTAGGATPGSWIIEAPGTGGGGSGGDASGPVTAINAPGEVGTRYTDSQRLTHLTLGFVPVVPTPQPVTYMVSSDNGATWVWVGSQKMLHTGQQLLIDRLAPGQSGTWKIAAVAGNQGGNPTPVADANLDALYPGVVRSAGFLVNGLATPAQNLGMKATIGACYNVITADGLTQYGVIPGLTYYDPVGTTAFFVRVTSTVLDASGNVLQPEQPHGGTQITGPGNPHTLADHLITYVPGMATVQYKFYVANRNSQGEGDFTDSSTNTLQLVTFNSTPPAADHFNVPITIPPFTPVDPGTVFNVTSVTASEVGPKYQDQKQGLHTSVGVIPVIDHDYSSPRTVTIWFDFGDGVPVWQGQRALTVAGQVLRFGDQVLGTDGVPQSGDIWVPANTTRGNWKVYCGAGKIDNGVNPNAYAQAGFTVVPVAACSPSGTTNAKFINNPDANNPGYNTPFIYSKYDPGVWFWEYYELTWQPPTLAAEPNLWFVLVTVQKGHWDGTNWTPAPDQEGRNEDPTGHFLGRVHAEVVMAPGPNPNQISVMSKYGANPATWYIPPAQNPDGSTNIYRDFRFLLYEVSRLGTDSSGSGGAGTYTLQTGCWPGSKSFYILTPQPQASVLDIRAANPATIQMPLVGGNGQPLTVSAYNPATGTGGIGSTYLGAQSVTAVNMAAGAVTAANNALAANAVVNGNINDVSIAKVTAGTQVFTGDVILSRGIGLPVIDLASTGITLFGKADPTAGTAGLLTQPNVVVKSTGILLSQGGTSGAPGSSVFVDGGNGAITIYSVNGDITHPYFTVSSSGLSLVNGTCSFAVSSNALSFVDTTGTLPTSTGKGNRIDINSTGVKITHGLFSDGTIDTPNSSAVLIMSNSLQFTLAGIAQVTIDGTGLTLSNGTPTTPATSSVKITPSTVTITNGSLSAATISGATISGTTITGGSITGTALSINTAGSMTVAISNTTSGVEVTSGTSKASIHATVIQVYDNSGSPSIGTDVAPTSLIVGRNMSSFCGFNANAGTGNEGLVVGGRQVCKLDSNNWLGGLQFATGQVFAQVFGIYNVVTGWPQTASGGPAPMPPGGQWGPALAAGQSSSFKTGDGRTAYVIGGLIVNVTTP